VGREWGDRRFSQCVRCGYFNVEWNKHQFINCSPLLRSAVDTCKVPA
jgi:hypothetical protein